MVLTTFLIHEPLDFVYVCSDVSCIIYLMRSAIAQSVTKNFHLRHSTLSVIKMVNDIAVALLVVFQPLVVLISYCTGEKISEVSLNRFK